MLFWCFYQTGIPNLLANVLIKGLTFVFKGPIIMVNLNKCLSLTTTVQVRLGAFLTRPVNPTRIRQEIQPKRLGSNK